MAPSVIAAPWQYTDLGNAERLTRKFGHLFRYVPAWKQWIVWDGTRWAIDDTGQLERWAVQTVRAMYPEAQSLPSADERAELVKHAIKSEGERRLVAMVRLAQTLSNVAIRTSDLDQDPYLFAVANGTIDLRTGELQEHNPSDLITKFSDIRFDKDATCPQWMAFLSRIMAGREDLIRFVQKAVGYSLSGDTGEQCLFFCHGGGANGKSTLLELVRHILGEYAMTASFDTFTAKRGDGPRTDIARLRGARFVTGVEADEGQRFAESVIKQLTGGDTVVARHLYAAEFEYRPRFKLWLAANHKPAVRGTDQAIWRRIRLIPFEVVIPEDERDKGFPDRLREEAQGIFRWAVDGCQMWLEEGLGTPESVRAATEQYREEEDPLSGFLDDACDLTDPHAVISATALYQAYRRYAMENGMRVLNQTVFGRKLNEKGISGDKNGPGKTSRRIGVQLRHPPDSSYTASSTVREPSNTNGRRHMDSSGQFSAPFTTNSSAKGESNPDSSTVREPSADEEVI